jgi:hypothetical protein
MTDSTDKETYTWTESVSESSDLDSQSPKNENERDDRDDGDESEGQVTGLMDDILEATDGQDTVTLGELLDHRGGQTYGPLLLIPSLVALSPIGMVPGMSVVTGSVLILIAVQMVFGLKHPWVPKRLEDFSFKRKRVEEAAEQGRPWTKWLDSLSTPRLEFFAGPWMMRVLALVFIVLALTFYPLAFVPFGVAAPAAAASVLALGILARDGVFVIIGLAMTGGALAMLVWLWPNDLNFLFGF